MPIWLDELKQKKMALAVRTQLKQNKYKHNRPIETTSGSTNTTSRLPPGAACRANSDCRADLYCRKASCSAETGLCSLSDSLSCGSAYQPVCGCDGITYQNPCAAYGKRQSIRYLTPCGISNEVFL
eukprot:TRINITY_DN1490_c0_g1_i3.p2 TRINITY_DN1490_c0_g1~~TRINITY_DN1490_c0_g1_i3.p2  ORF type:complete len:126 (-),score=12.36 TRINITY_DN1490_c0_g1_i3:478-855(-)